MADPYTSYQAFVRLSKWNFTLGVALGVLAGLIPGVGVFYLLLLPFVYDLSVPDFLFSTLR